MNQRKLKKSGGRLPPHLYTGTADCFLQTFKNEGFWAFYKGFIPTLFRMGPWNIIFFVTYEQLKKMYWGFFRILFPSISFLKFPVTVLIGYCNINIIPFYYLFLLFITLEFYSKLFPTSCVFYFDMKSITSYYLCI